MTVHAARLDDLFICNACDEEGVPDLERGFGKHTEEHHLIRCLEPEKADDQALPTEQRLTSIEGRLDRMQSQLDDLSRCLGDLSDFIKNFDTRIDARIGSIEHLFKPLGPGPSTSAA
jgi:hypothetical protein